MPVHCPRTAQKAKPVKKCCANWCHASHSDGQPCPMQRQTQSLRKVAESQKKQRNQTRRVRGSSWQDCSDVLGFVWSSADAESNEGTCKGSQHKLAAYSHVSMKRVCARACAIARAHADGCDRARLRPRAFQDSQL